MQAFIDNDIRVIKAVHSSLIVIKLIFYRKHNRKRKSNLNLKNI